MNRMKKNISRISVAAALLLLGGCGGGGGGDSVAGTESSSSTGYLVDSAVANCDYDCIADGDYNKTTDASGAFQCRSMDRVRFRIGELVLGEIRSLPADSYVLPQDLIGVERTGTFDDPRVTRMAQLLQSLDEDSNLSNGIQIPDLAKEELPSGTIDEEADALPGLLDELASALPLTLRTETEAREHLRETLRTIEGGTGGGEDRNSTLPDQPDQEIGQELKDALAHMGNEERLAYDIYHNLYLYHQQESGTEISQLYNIAENSERIHVGIVQGLVREYALTADQLDNVTDPVADRNISFDQMPSGVYDVPSIQDLYDTLYARGVESPRAALEVGCMVEVTDVEDLDRYIALAEEDNASDILDGFTTLRSGSYTHYWAFDKGLKNMGVSDGCCSLGEAYCHPEYPNDEHGQGGGSGGGHRGGRG